MADSKTITISREEVQKRGGLIILPLKEYQKLLESAAPTYYLKGKEASNLDRLVEKGLQEYRNGKTVGASSMKDAMRTYARRKN
mgnify:CR=1 FL=1